MSAFFESALLFSLAILIVLVGLLVYYFKGRLLELEQKNNQSLDIIKDVYTAHIELKATVEQMMIQKHEIRGGGFKSVSASESQYLSDSDSESDSESVSDLDENESTKVYMEISDLEPVETKTITLTPEEMHIVEDDIPDHSTDLPEEYDITDPEDVPITFEPEPLVINKLEIEESLADDTQSVNTGNASYKKMNLTELRAYIVANGICTDHAKLKHMKKPELIDMVNSAS